MSHSSPLACLLLICLLPIGLPAGRVPTMTRERQNEISPARALAKLGEGNRRFLSGKRRHQEYDKAVAVTASGQYPFASVVSCIDSRVPTELIFDQGIGSIMNARVAGPVINDDILGSLEFACRVTGTRLILVLGHTGCGAVKGAIDNVELGHLTELVDKIKPALRRVPSTVVPRSSKNSHFVDDAARENVRLVMREIRDRSTILRALEKDGEILVVGALYDVETGRVEFFRPE
ncbi:MAG: carbonic anhydrase family protein [Verrucomicrobiae bacterium]|nr:carbonic anhydrase family protein [Verrucomicrobiae bacterium]